LNLFGKNQNLASPKTSILSLSVMDSISDVARPDEVKGTISQREGTLKSLQILLIKINFYGRQN